MKEKDIYYRCDVCGYLIHFLQAKYAKFNILERCPRCHAGGDLNFIIGNIMKARQRMTDKEQIIID